MITKLIPFYYHARMDIKRLRYFIAAAEDENLHRAAARLHVVQPALSKQIVALEQELGCKLFLRSKGRIHLTPAGRQYLDDARRIMRELQQARERAVQIALGQLGLLRVGFRETAGRSQIVSGALNDFRSRHPDVEIRLNQLTSPAQCEALRRGELDVGFVYRSDEHGHGLEHLPLGTDHFFLAMPRSHALADRKHIDLADLVDQPFIWLARSRNAYYSDALLHDCMHGGLTPRVIQEADSDATALNLVAVGMGISFVVSPTDASPLPNVVLRRVRQLDHPLQLVLAWNDERKSAHTANFIDVVRQVRRKFPQPGSRSPARGSGR
jgi:DNA-binding transcriptional LysR family regulator